MARLVSASLSSAGPIWGSDASISADGCFRWWLTRRWRPGGRVLIFLGLNPSRADAERDDPTLRRLIGFAGDWGYDALVVVNLFARISASPSVLRRSSDPIGLDNDTALLRWCQLWAHQEAWALWCGWGNGGGRFDRAQQVMDLLQPVVQQRSVRFPLAPGPQAIALTRSGQPRHPLYAPRGCLLKPFQWASTDAIGHPEETPSVPVQH